MNARWLFCIIGLTMGCQLALPVRAEFDFFAPGYGVETTPAKTPAEGTAQTGPANALSPDVGISTAAPTQDSPAVRAILAAPVEEEYRIGANDLLEISVFQVKELDRTLRVNARGFIALPLVGQISAAGLTATELETRIADKLKESYLQDPQVNVFIKEYTSQRVTVEGQVEKAGIYPIAGQTTLLQALALSGGLTKIGDTKISVFRLMADGKRQMVSLDIEEIRAGKLVDPVMKNNDIIVVGTNEIRNFIETLRGFISLGTLR